MGRIIVLDENTSNKIAAGEVVEKPASVVKELVENSIDAGATSISVEIKNGGISLIKVTDNGCGIEEDDAVIAFERHATSKIKKADDLDSIATMGFRGEALASIASVASVELQTKTAQSEYGMYVHIAGGEFKEVRPVGCSVGTTFTIRDLFYNTPARYKFLKKDSTEAGYVSDTVSRIALGNPGISFKFVNNKVSQIHTPGNNDLKSAIYSIYGKEIVKELIEVSYKDEKFEISGYIGKPEASRANRNYQSLYINKRYVKSRLVSYAVEQAYSSILMKNKFPFFVLNINLNPQLVDANVHPAKMDVRFADESNLSRALYMAVSNALNSDKLFNPVSVSNKDRELFKFSDVEPRPKYVQEKLNYPTASTAERSGIITAMQINKNANSNSAAEIRSFSKALEPLARADMKEISVKSEQVFEDAIKAVAESSINSISISAQNEKVSDKEDVLEGSCSESFIKESHTQPLKAAVKSEIDCFKETTLNLQKSEIIETSGESQEILPEEFVIEESASAENEVNEFSDMKYIGQVFSTYIILQNGEELVLVDQHAAHERILYEKLKTKYESRENTTQLLLEPVVIQLQAYELDLIKSNTNMFDRIGFLFEDFGNNSIIIRGMPYLAEGYCAKELFLEMTDKLQDSLKPVNTVISDEIIHTIACKAAIKANKKLSEEEVRQLLRDLGNTGRKYTCPHGRPTVVRLTKYEIEKMFKRII